MPFIDVPPQLRLNANQVPLPVVVDNNKTYERELLPGEKVSGKQTGIGLDKRQYKMQLCFAPEIESPEPVIVFRVNINLS